MQIYGEIPSSEGMLSKEVNSFGYTQNGIANSTWDAES